MKLLIIFLLYIPLHQSFATIMDGPDTTLIQKAAEAAEQEAREAARQFNLSIEQITTVSDTCNAMTESTSKCTCYNSLFASMQNMDSLKIKSAESCNATADTAQKACAASTYAPYVSLIVSQVNSASGSSMYDKCKKAATLQTGMGAVSAGLAGACYFTKKKCENACGIVSRHFETGIAKLERVFTQAAACGDTSISPQIQDLKRNIGLVQDRIAMCEKQELNIMSALVSAQQLIQGIAQSQACQKELAGDECMKPEATQNPSCTAAYCSVAANQSAPQCVAMFGECYSANAAANPKCACLQNPMQAGCINLPSIDNNNVRNTAGLDDMGNYNFDEDDLYGEQENPLDFGAAGSQAPGIAGSGNSGGGGGGLGGSGGLGGGPSGGGAGGQPKSVYDTNVLGGTSAGGAPMGGLGGGGGGYASTGYGSGSGNAPSGVNFGKGNLDLKKYLPGGQYAKQREEADTGITPANGLSNFQKVNRALNQNRGKLVTP